MRGGSLAPLIWGALLAMLGTICAIWTGDGIQIGEFAFAVAVVWMASGSFAALSRDALRRGGPPARQEVQRIPLGSAGAPLLALGTAAAVFGFAFGSFLVYFGAGVAAAAAGLLVRELADQRRAGDALRERDRR